MKQRLSDCFVQNWRGDMLSNDSLLIYKHLQTDFEYEAYLDMINNSQYIYLFTQMRVSAHILTIQTGRYGRNRIEKIRQNLFVL